MKPPYKILILSMSCDRPCFVQEEELAKQTWAKCIMDGLYPNIKYFSYRGNSSENRLDFWNNIIYLNVGDSFEDTYHKTLNCFRFILQNHIDFDYIVRTNTSNYLNVPIINDFIQTLPEEDDCIYSAELDTWATTPIRFLVFARGNFFFTSKKVVQRIVEHQDDRGTDDVMIATSLFKYYNKIGIDYFSKLRQIPCVSYEKGDTYSYSYEKYANKMNIMLKKAGTPAEVDSRKDIRFRMQNIYDNIQKETRKFSIPIATEWESTVRHLGNEWTSDLQQAKEFFFEKNPHLLPKPKIIEVVEPPKKEEEEVKEEIVVQVIPEQPKEEPKSIVVEPKKMSVKKTLIFNSENVHKRTLKKKL